MENQLVTILRIKTPQVGSLVKDKFELEGIECFFTNKEQTLGSVYNPDEVLLNVKAHQTEKAVQILLQIHQDYDFEKVKLNETFKGLKKILFPLDLSDDCLPLCSFAVSFANKINAEIKLLYVYKDPIINEHGKHTASWEKHVKMELNEARKKAHQKMADFSTKLKKHLPKDVSNQVKLHYRILKGSPHSVIADASKRYIPDLILMGNTAEQIEKGDLAGKTLLKVIEQTNYPILAVPISASINMKEKIKIMHATNFYEKHYSSLNSILKLLEPFEKEIHCVHIDLKDDPLHQQKVDELNKMLATEYSEHNIKCELFESENIPKGIYDYTEKNKIDIVTLSKTKRSSIYKIFHNSLLEKLAIDGKIPALIFPE